MRSIPILLISICLCASMAQAGRRTYTIRPDNLAVMNYPLGINYTQDKRLLSLRLPVEICKRKGRCGNLSKVYLTVLKPKLRAPLAYEEILGITDKVEIVLHFKVPSEIPLRINAEYRYQEMGDDTLDVMTFLPTDFLPTKRH